MHDARLHRGLRVDRFDCLREPFQPVDTRDQDVLDAALLEIVEDLHPELRALVGLKPHAQDITLTVDPDRHRQVAGTPLDRAAVADLQHQRVEEDDRIDVIQWPCLPGPSVVHDRIGHPRDQIAADLDPVDLLQVSLDIPGRQAPRIEREDLVVEPLEAPLTLADYLRLKRARAIARSVDRHLALLGDQRLRRRPVPGVACPACRFLVGLIAQVVGELDLHRPLDQPFRQLAQQPARARDLLLRSGPREELVDELVREQRLDLLGQLGPRGQLAARSASASLRSPYGLTALRAGATRIRGLIQPASDCRRHESPFENSCLHRRPDTPIYDVHAGGS